jgi:hypothetical protein
MELQRSLTTNHYRFKWDSPLVLPYDNTDTSRTGVAIVNQSTSAATVTAVLLDQAGTEIASSPINLPPLGHKSFFVADQFSQAASRIGIIKFQNPLGNVSGIGLLFYPNSAFTSLPILQ